MNDDLRDRLLGDMARDPGCEACFAVLDEYAETVLRGGDVARLFPGVIAHLRGCPACREDAEGLLAALRSPAPPEDPR